MNNQSVLTDIQKKRFSPIYFLHGKEPYFTEVLEKKFIADAIPTEEKDFNQHVLYAKDHDLHTVLKLAQQFPMMGERQLILVKEAHLYKNFDLLAAYAKVPMSQTILVFSYKGKKLDARIEKKLAGVGFVISNALYENKVPDWITTRVVERGLTIEPKASVLLCEFLGNELSKIDNELGKLEVILPAGSLISTSVVERNIGISKDFNVFELVSAIANKDVLKSVTIVDYFSKNSKNHPFVVSISSLYNFFSKVLLVHFSPSSSPDVLSKVLSVNRFFVKDYQVASVKYSRKEVAENIQFLSEYDLKSKGVNNASVTDSELLKELVFKLLH